jgi:hypothetical protein
VFMEDWVPLTVDTFHAPLPCLSPCAPSPSSPVLAAINLSGTGITDGTLSTLAPMCHLRHLSVEGCGLLTPRGMSPVIAASSPALKSLMLSGSGALHHDVVRECGCLRILFRWGRSQKRRLRYVTGASKGLPLVGSMAQNTE